MTICILKTDRKKGNRVQDKDNVLHVVEWLKQYGVEIVVKSHDWGTHHDLYSIHRVKNGKECEPFEAWFASGKTLDEVHLKLMAIVALFQNKYIVESAKVENNTRHEWRLERIE